MAGQFIAVGANRTYLTSSDGVTWAETTMDSVFGATDQINEVYWAEELGLWIAVGAAGKIGTSPDGSTWTAQTSGVAAALTGGAWSADLGLLVVTGNSNTLLTSPDGITWTARTSGFGAGDSIADVVWSPDVGRFVACVSTTSQVSRSTDGVTWTAQTLGATGRGFFTLEWADSLSLFIAAGDRILWTSPDGITWTVRTYTIIGSSEVVTSQGASAWSPDLGLAILGSGTRGADTSSRTDTSTDGINWTKRNIGVDTIVIDDFAWSSELALFAMAINTKLYTSTDGITWTLQHTAGQNIEGLGWGALATHWWVGSVH